jgi:spermidine synthase
VSVVAGDGRLSILKYKGDTGKYDIIIVDAFSGGGIPTHLLTTEAIEVYKNRLAPRGLLVFHITNRYYDLRPVLKSISDALHLSGAMSSYIYHLKEYEEESLYVVLANHSTQLEPLLNRGWKRFGDDDGLQNITAWTDDYINILATLKQATILSDEMKMLLTMHKNRMTVHRNQVDKYSALHG